MAVVDKSRVRYATRYHAGFYQIVKDNRFPICRPYGTPGSDKEYDFGEKFWDGTYYQANAANAKYLKDKGFNKRNKKVREDFEAGGEFGKSGITNDDWNAALTKLRQEFSIRFDFDRSSMQTIQTNKVEGVSDNNEFFVDGDYMLQQNYHKIYCDILSILLYETHDTTQYSDRLPASRFSYDIADGQGKGTRKNLDVEPNAETIEEGYHEGNNWFTGEPMREYRYRRAMIKLGDIEEKIVNGVKQNVYVEKEHMLRDVDGTIPIKDDYQPISEQNPKLVKAYSPEDIETNHLFGYTPSEDVKIYNGILKAEVNVKINKRPRGNFDYVKTDSDGNPIVKPGTKGMYDVSDQFKEVIKFMEDFKGKDIPYKGQKQVPDGKDAYGRPKYKTLYKDGQMKLINVLTLPQDDEGYTISIKANDVNTYFMHVINLLSDICICNCNYCSCYGHEASCTCYVVKASGWCYSYMYL